MKFDSSHIVPAFQQNDDGPFPQAWIYGDCISYGDLFLYTATNLHANNTKDKPMGGSIHLFYDNRIFYSY